MVRKFKTGKIKSGTGDVIAASSLPLDEQIERSNLESQRNAPRVKERALKRAKPDDEYIGADLSTKILNAARKQKRDEEDEGDQSGTATASNAKRLRQVSLGGLSLESLSDNDDVEDNDFDDEVVELDPQDEAAVEKFMAPKEMVKRRTLFDIIQEKIDQKQFEIESQMSQASDLNVRQLDPAVVEMFKEVGVVLSRYRSGKIPKAFKVIPKMVNWEQLVYLTNPDKWSAAAMYQATRIFASNLSPKLCQRFYNLVLLPRLRDDIDEFKKLNFHLYQALHKAMYKPQAFFKGILLPLCESGTCSLREATIFGSVLTKASIPMLHAAAAMLKIAEMEYSGANSLFLRIFIDKKFTVPARAIDGVFQHFLRFRKEKRQLPVLWHQSFLAFVQRYKDELSKEQKDALWAITEVHHHYQISPEIRRELRSSGKATEPAAGSAKMEM